MADSDEPGKGGFIERSLRRLRKAIERPIGQPEPAREEVPIGWDFGPDGQPGEVTGSDQIGSRAFSDPSGSYDIRPIDAPNADVTIRGDSDESRPSEPTDERAQQLDGSGDIGLEKYRLPDGRFERNGSG